jgi:hypothetical protein
MTKLRQVSESIFAASNLMYRRQVDIIPFNDVPFCLTYLPYDKKIIMQGELLEIEHTFLHTFLPIKFGIIQLLLFVN